MRRLIVFVLLGLLFVFLINYYYLHTDCFRQQLISLQKFNNVPAKIEVANVGTSHGEKGLNYADCQLAAFNFGLSGQRFQYDLRLLKYYRRHFQKNAVLLIPVSYPSFGAYSEEDINAQKLRYYHLLSPLYIYHFSWQDYLLNRAFPVIGAGERVKDIVGYWHNNLHSADWNLGYNKFAKTIDAVAHEKYRIFQMKGGFSSDSIAALRQMIAYAQARQFQPVLITTPITDNLNRLYQQRYLASFYQTVLAIAKEFAVPYWDYSHDLRFCNDLNLFMDSDHLNINGSKKFTRIVLQDLTAHGLLGFDKNAGGKMFKEQ